MLVGAAVMLMGGAVLAALEGARLTNWTGLAAPKVDVGQRRGCRGPQDRACRSRKSATYALGATDRPVKVFVLAGDSNMAGRAKNLAVEIPGEPG